MFIVYGWQLNLRYDRVYRHWQSDGQPYLTLDNNESVWLVPGTITE